MTASTMTVVVSDFHAGAAESLLTVLDENFHPDPGQTSPTTMAFAAAFLPLMQELTKYGGKPDLVLLGDVLDLSLGKPDHAARIFSNFLKAIKAGQMFANVAFVPGNHDHELWTAERFGATSGAVTSPSDKAFWAHSSPAFTPPSSMGTTAVLNKILAEGGMKEKVATYYPNLGMPPVTAPGRATRLAVMHHGHFVESAYTAMSSLLAMIRNKPVPPLTAETIEEINGAWIDFVWSTLGDSGRIGSEATLAEILMVTGGAAHALQDRVAAVLSRQAQTGLGLPVSGVVTLWLQRFSRGLVDATMGAYSDLERFSYDQYLSADTISGLQTYLTEVVASQIAAELPGVTAADHLTFVFGHTHKAFADQLAVKGFDAPVSIYNTGGWVLDTALLSTVEGAGVLFLDGGLNSAMLQIYALTGAEEVLPACVVCADPGLDANNPMLAALQGALTKTAPQWAAFQTVVAAELRKKQDMYLALGDRNRRHSAQRGLA